VTSKIFIAIFSAIPLNFLPHPVQTTRVARYEEYNGKNRKQVTVLTKYSNNNIRMCVKTGQQLYWLTYDYIIYSDKTKIQLNKHEQQTTDNKKTDPVDLIASHDARPVNGGELILSIQNTTRVVLKRVTKTSDSVREASGWCTASN